MQLLAACFPVGSSTLLPANPVWLGLAVPLKIHDACRSGGLGSELVMRLSRLVFSVHRPTVAALMSLGTDMASAASAGAPPDGAKAQAGPGEQVRMRVHTACVSSPGSHACCGCGLPFLSQGGGLDRWGMCTSALE